MKKETVEAFLEIIDDEPTVKVKGTEVYISTDKLIDFLKTGVKSNRVKACTPKFEEGYTSYKFKVYNDEGQLNNYFIIKVKNKERYLHKQTIETIKEITGVSNLIRKLNITRFIAGVAISATILTVAGPTLVKGLQEILEKDYEYDQQRYRQHYSSEFFISDEDKAKSDIEYYKDLKVRAENGDEEAKREYQEYLVEQELKKQFEEERSKRR